MFELVIPCSSFKVHFNALTSFLLDLNFILCINNSRIILVWNGGGWWVKKVARNSYWASVGVGCNLFSPIYAQYRTCNI